MPKRLPLISVVMPCFNAQERLQISLKSVLAQTYSNLELVVVNDGSTDSSLQILETFGDSRLKIINQQNSGVCKARNHALAEVTGEYAAFLDADDTWHPEFLDKLYQALVSSPEAKLAYCGWQNVGLPNGRGKPFIPPDYEQPAKAELLFENCRWPIHATLTHRSVIEEAGCFDERFLTSEDFLLWLKIGVKYPIKRVPGVLAFYHHHGSLQATRNKEKIAINHWLAQRAFLKDNEDFDHRLGSRCSRRLMYGVLLSRGYDCYWNGDLKAARAIFSVVMKNRYGSFRDWKYMLPSMLPYPLHLYLIQHLNSKQEKAVNRDIQF